MIWWISKVGGHIQHLFIIPFASLAINVAIITVEFRRQPAKEVPSSKHVQHSAEALIVRNVVTTMDLMFILWKPNKEKLQKSLESMSTSKIKLMVRKVQSKSNKRLSITPTNRFPNAKRSCKKFHYRLRR